MRNLLYLLLVSVVFFSCIKKEEDPQTKSEKEFQEYLKNNNIKDTLTASGLYYIQTLAGTGAQPVPGNFVMINVTGMLLDGKIIETNDSLVASGKGMVCLTRMQHPYKGSLEAIGFPGVVEGIKKMREGGKARLILPYKLGMGIYGTKTIPYYSNLIYDVELVKVIPDQVIYDSLLVKQLIDSGFVVASSSPDTVYFLSETPGIGSGVEDNDTAVIKYTRRTVDGIVTDHGDLENAIISSTYLKPGFLFGLKQMKEGGKATMLIKYKYGFGSEGFYDMSGDYYLRQVVPPYSSIIIDVELVTVKKLN